MKLVAAEVKSRGSPVPCSVRGGSRLVPLNECSFRRVQWVGECQEPFVGSELRWLSSDFSSNTVVWKKKPLMLDPE